MVLGFDDKSARNEIEEAFNTIEMAFNMIDIIDEVKQDKEFEGLNMRIGLHIV